MDDGQRIIATANYRKMCEPFETAEAADEAVNALWKEFYELRNKHHLPDVTVIVRTSYLTKDGEEVDGLLTLHAGSELQRESMAAFAHGQAVSDRQEMMGKFLRGAATDKRRKK